MVLFYTELEEVKEHSITAMTLFKLLWKKVSQVNSNVIFYSYDVVKNDVFLYIKV